MADVARVSVVLGGTGTIGSAISRRLAYPGGVLVLGFLQNRGRADELARELANGGTRTQLLEGNLADEQTLERLSGMIQELGGACHDLVHCVAVTSFKPLASIRPNQWSLILDVSARSFLDATTSLLEPLARAGGSIVAISSHGSVRYVPAYGALGPAKAALESSVRQLAGELAPRGIRVNAVRAGLIEGDTAKRFPAETLEGVIRRTPLRRLGRPEDVAGAVTFLLGKDASWISGQVLEVDGGFSLT